MCTDNIIIPVTIIDNYLNYRKAISTGLANTAIEYKNKFIDALFTKYFIQCIKCSNKVEVITCDTVTLRCTPSITEYVEVKTCIKNKCITIVEI